MFKDLCKQKKQQQQQQQEEEEEEKESLQNSTDFHKFEILLQAEFQFQPNKTIN